MKKKLFNSIMIFVLLLVVLLSLTGCRTISEKDIKNTIKKELPNSTFVRVEEVSKDKKIYYFEYKGLDFTVTDSMYNSEFAITKQQSVECNYVEMLINNKKDMIENLAKNENIDMDLSAGRDGINMRFNINSYEQIEKIEKVCRQSYNLLQEYLPENNLYDNSWSIIFFFKGEDGKTKRLMSDKKTLNKQKFNICDNIEYAKYFYIEYAKKGVISQNGVTEAMMEDHRPAEIKNLYINGQEFIYEKDSWAFWYDVNTDKYYISVDDKLHEKVLTKFYKQSNYKENEEKRVVTYSINGDSYTIKTQYDSNNNVNYIFLKNWKILNIKDKDLKFVYSTHSEYYKNVYNRTISKSVYDRFISIDDCAELWGLKIDKIDFESDSIFFKTK